MFGASLNFVAIELFLLILIGLFTAKLRCYKLVNSLLKSMPLSHDELRRH